MDDTDITAVALRVASGHLTIEEVVAQLPDPDDETSRTVTQAAEVLGVSPHTIRYYERLGLVEVPRDAAGHRSYDGNALRRLTFLVRMRVSGMGMADLQRYVELIEGGEATVPERLDLMLEHRDTIRLKIAELQLSLVATEYKIATYGGHLGDPDPTRQTRQEKP
ncbi:MerR family transcriptional regulator [Naumannella sp. ID2617S]|nr:MerR family transcriptional regulator [Naumannella sp. ID2617S]